MRIMVRDSRIDMPLRRYIVLQYEIIITRLFYPIGVIYGMMSYSTWRKNRYEEVTGIQFRTLWTTKTLYFPLYSANPMKRLQTMTTASRDASIESPHDSLDVCAEMSGKTWEGLNSVLNTQVAERICFSFSDSVDSWIKVDLDTLASPYLDVWVVRCCQSRCGRFDNHGYWIERK